MAGRDPMTVSYRMILAIVLAIVITAPALVSAGNISIVDDFPVSSNGEHNISLEYRAGGVYHALTKVSPALFAYPEPTAAGQEVRHPVISLGEHGENATWVNTTRCYIRPAAVNISGLDADGVIRVSLPQDAGEIEVTGTATVQSGDVIFRIYRGEDAYSHPIWSSDTGGSFHLTIPGEDGSALFFAVQARGDDIRDVAYWEDVRIAYTTTPMLTTPATPASTTQTTESSSTTTTNIAETMTDTPVQPASPSESHNASSDLPWAAIGVVVAAVISSITSVYVAARSKR